MNFRNTTHTKRLQMLFFIIIIPIIGIAQEPPPVFKFSVDQITSDIETFLVEYKISTFLLGDSIFTEKLNISIRKNEDLIKNVEGNSIYVYIYSEIILLPKEGDIIRFSLKKKNTNEKMNVFIRIAFDMDFGEVFEISNLTFQHGDFFLDKCKSKKKYQESNTPRGKVDLLNLKKHKIPIKKIKRILDK